MLLKLGKIISYFLLSCTAIFVLGAVLVLFDNDDGKKMSAFFGFLLFAGITGFPGVVLLYNITKTQGSGRAKKMVKGYITTRRRFSMDEAVQDLELEKETIQTIIFDLINSGQANLMYHRQNNEYIHSGDLESTAKVFRRCDSCGAKLPQVLQLRGESADCPFCGAGLES